MRINNNNNNANFKGVSNLAKPLSTFYNPNAVIPTLIIEAGVTLGRSYEAYKRGGKKEATERFVEQGVSAVVWVWGVQAIKKIGELFGKKILKMDLDFDIVENALKKEAKNITSKQKAFKAGNLLFSTALATYFIGFVLPKITHKISSIVTKKDKEKEKNENKKENLSFTSLTSIAQLLESNQTARLLATDTGVIAGRFLNSRNKYEKIESLFRDITSIYFYLRSTKDFVKLMNKTTKNVDIDPLILKEAHKNYSNEIPMKDLLNNSMKSAYKNRFVSGKDLNKIQASIESFANRAKDCATKEQFEKLINSNIRKNFAFYSIGTAISMLALGILIPKIQYFITRKLTNQNKFPGDEENFDKKA